MRKLLTILGAVSLVATSSSSVIACNNPVPPPPVEKVDLTDELLKEFVKENNEFSYEGPFVFEEGYLFSDKSISTYWILGTLALTKFYDSINENFNYDGFSFIGGSAEIVDKTIESIKNNVKYTFKVGFSYRSNNKFNQEQNDKLFFNFTFIQTKKYDNLEYLNKFFNFVINQDFYENNRGMSTSKNKKIDIFQTIRVRLTSKALEEIADKTKKIEKLEEEFINGFKNDEGTQSKSFLNSVKINIKDFDKSELDEYRDTYNLDLKIALKDNISIFINKKLNIILSKKG
ncbi:lipoprotein [Spiroplasma cantharicola]|uniref:Lipoprotein n=1 Tax=Spiroplasma cantharicola TaxID=362837 RepID=A0A0M4JRX5_9MOLU|nr:lipoprotein [Spiroplasma cantharicola]ALD66197.1 hypothetical protein SCANT_v1c02870 [Spiroplasma cantharicola]